MKAIVCRRYGSPDALSFEEIEKPSAAATEALIRVRAASINPLDWHTMRGTPVVFRVGSGVRKPKDTRLGVDVAGQVEAVGGEVTRFKPGDEVFGTGHGALAEYACASEAKLAMKPETVTFEQAASVPIAGLTALQGLRDKGRLGPGRSVLINGAAGGVGTFAVQIAKAFGANVTGVCSTRNQDLVRSIGADRVIDYTREDFTRSEQRFDVIYDLVANHSLLQCRRVMNPGGRYLAVGVGPGMSIMAFLARGIRALVLSRFVSQNLSLFVANSNKDDLAVLAELMANGKVTPVIDRRYGLSELPEAMRYLEKGHARGKVVITLG
jgi:NADPH:quinone reductase-like Zn-dependent oxidoreductase